MACRRRKSGAVEMAECKYEMELSVNIDSLFISISFIFYYIASVPIKKCQVMPCRNFDLYTSTSGKDGLPLSVASRMVTFQSLDTPTSKLIYSSKQLFICLFSFIPWKTRVLGWPRSTSHRLSWWYLKENILFWVWTYRCKTSQTVLVVMEKVRETGRDHPWCLARRTA